MTQNQSKIQGKFYPLQHEEWLKVCKSLTKSQMSVLYYLRSIDPYSNGVSIKASQIAKEIGVTKRSVNSAIAVLTEKGYLELEDVEYSIKVHSGGCLCDTSTTVTEVGNEFPTQEKDFSLEKTISQPRNEFPSQEKDFSLEKTISHSPPEKHTQQELQTPKTLNILKDIKNTTETRVGVEKVFQKYEDSLRLYGIYSQIWNGESLEPNQRLIEVQNAIAHVPVEKVEAGLRAFIAWMKTATGVRNKYKALETSILKGWEV